MPKKVDDIERARRKIAAKRLRALIWSIPDPEDLFPHMTPTSFARRYGFDQSRLSRWLDIEGKSAASFDVRTAIELSIIDEEHHPGMGRSVLWWLAVDASIDAMPKGRKQAALRRIHFEELGEV